MERALSTDTWDLLSKNSILFLSETWMTENKYQDLFPEKTTFVVHPKKKSKGRALGGLKTVNSHDRESLKTCLLYTSPSPRD